MSASGRPSEARRRRPWRALVAFLALLLALPLLLVGAVLVAANTEPGRNAIARLATRFVDGLTIEGLQGPLPGRPGFARLTMADADGVWLEVEDARLAWDPRALLRRELRIDALTARRVALHRLPPSEPPAQPEPPGPLIPQLPQLPLSLRLDRLEVGRIELAEPVAGVGLALRLAGHAQLDAEGLSLDLDSGLDGGTTLTARIALTPKAGRLAAQIALRGEAGGPLSRLAGLGDRPLSLDLTLDGPETGAVLTLKAAAGDGLGAELAGTIAAPDAARFAAQLEGQVDGSGLIEPPLGEFAGPYAIRLDATRRPDGLVELRGLHLDGKAGQAQAEGLVDPERDRTRLRLHVALPTSSTFGTLVPDAVAWETLVADAEITGLLTAPHVTLDIAPTGLRSSVAEAGALLGTAPRGRLRIAAPDLIEELTLTGQGMRVELHGRVGETLDVTFAAAVDATGTAVPGLDGAIRLTGTATGAAQDPTLTLSLQSERLEAAGRAVERLSVEARIATLLSRPSVEARGSGRLQDLPLSISVQGTPEEGDWLRLNTAEARLGPVKLTAIGRINPSRMLAEGTAKLDTDDLAPLSPLLGQPISGTVRIEARGELREDRQAFTARVEVPRLAAAGVTARDLKASIDGSLAALEANLTGIVNDIEAEARAKLTELEGGARRVEFAALRATGYGETIRLSAPSTITLKPDGGVQIGATTIALRSVPLRAEGTWGPERADLRATLANLNLAAFAALAPDVSPVGTLSGEARVTGPVGSPEASLTLNGTGLRADIPAARGLPGGELRLEAKRAGDGAITGNAELRIGPQQRLATTVRFPRGPAATTPFEATLDGALDLGPLTTPLLAAGADRVTGRLTLGLRVSGTPTAPSFGGEARLANGSYRDAVQGVTVTELAGTIRPNGSQLRLDLTGRTPSDGRLALSGTVEPLAPGLPIDLALNMTNAQPVASDLLRATLDAELRLTGRLREEARISGPLRIRRAEIRVPERLGSSVRTLEPVIERGTPPNGAARATPVQQAPRAPAAQSSLPILLAIEVIAPSQVNVRGRGLDTELGGRLDITGRADAPEIKGSLQLRRGDITIIGRRIRFTSGRLDWGGDPIPYLDFTASSQAGPVTARVNVTGPATAPEITFSSTPELPQDEILARLLFDRPLRDLSPLEIAQLASAVAGASGLPGGNAATGFLDRMRQAVGLDRLSIGSDSENAGSRTARRDRDNATLEAGRYVADGVYVGVKQGTEGGSRVGVRVDLTPRMRLEAETGDREGSRLGLNWEWQWGR